MRGPDTFTEGLFTMRRLDDFEPSRDSWVPGGVSQADVADSAS